MFEWTTSSVNMIQNFSNALSTKTEQFKYYKTLTQCSVEEIFRNLNMINQNWLYLRVLFFYMSLNTFYVCFTGITSSASINSTCMQMNLQLFWVLKYTFEINHNQIYQYVLVLSLFVCFIFQQNHNSDPKVVIWCQFMLSMTSPVAPKY